MSSQRPGRRIVIIVACWVASLVLVLLLAVYGPKYLGVQVHLQDVVGNTIKKGEILSRMRISLLKSVDLEKSAVLAITDEESHAFADESNQAAAAVDQERREFGSLVEAGGTADEMKLLQEFDNCWAQCRKIDAVLLAFAVQNTNLKAASLSFNKGAQAMKRFERGLNELIRVYSATPVASQIAILACQAVPAALKVYNLHAPHIATSSDEQMDKIEAEMMTEEEKVRNSLTDLAGLVDERGKALLEETRTAFADFMQVTAEVTGLSRQNSNIKSLELSLGRKRKVAAQCEEILTTLQETIRSRGFKATR